LQDYRIAELQEGKEGKEGKEPEGKQEAEIR
jgi:hypothetical protein